VRYLLRPAPGAPAAGPGFAGPARLESEFVARQRAGDIRFELCVQRFVDENATPIEDTAVAWTEAASPPIVVAELLLPRRDLSEAPARLERRIADDLGFNPWNTTDEFRPLGHLNRARKAVYDASLAHRQTRLWRAGRPPLRNRVIGGGINAALRALNGRRPWYRLPKSASLLNLSLLRQDLRQHNLIDTEPCEASPTARKVPPEITHEQRTSRTYDGRGNDLSNPAMGAVGAAFGRNMAPVEQSVDEPNAVLVARELMDRHAFIPAKILNLLAAAWIQFQVHDWVSHARRKPGEADVVVPIPDQYPGWTNYPGGPDEREMRFADNIPHPLANDDCVFANLTSHWWDGSEVYGADSEQAARLREGARIRLDNGYLPTNVHGFEVTGFNESWWLGLSIMHTLFAREHNVLCDELQRAYPGWSDERTYQTARLIVAALIAKIHTVEWTPAILQTEALDVAMKTNWYGPPADWITRLGIWLTDVHAMQGIPKTNPDHHNALYCLTEDFATVYRLHPLIPDDYVFHDHRDGRALSTRGFLDIQGDRSDEVMREIGLHDALYSFGIAHPGAITLHNFPRSLQNLERDGEIIDLSVIDIVRTRKRKVPRYNQFRRNLRIPAVTRWEDLTADPETNRQLKDIYRDIEQIDTVVGLLGETPPDGFGFSDTAFRIFILMASRRVQSDRFLNVDFRPEIYSPLGMDWIATNDMTSLILRHCPELAAMIPRGASAFAPWRPVY
ncbi:MAG: peroxidase family protein, partial [Allosphingosinicella sp.]